jgi:phosphoribosylformylglycinamidine synthase
MKDDINCSEYLHKLKGVEYSPAPYFDLEEEYDLQHKISELIKEGVIESAHDLSEGGLFITLCESGFTNELGFTVRTHKDLRKDAFLFGESQSRVVVSVSPAHFEAFENTIRHFPHYEIGIVSTGKVEIDGEEWGDIHYWKELYDASIEKHLSKEIESEALGML